MNNRKALPIFQIIPSPPDEIGSIMCDKNTYLIDPQRMVYNCRARSRGVWEFKKLPTNEIFIVLLCE